MSRLVYQFGEAKAADGKSLRALLGGKGAGLHEMTRLGLPVPPGFTITTEVCAFYFTKKTYPPELKKEVERGVKKVESTLGLRFGDSKSPLLVSVRSGAPISMPGMMDTILNLGLNDETVKGLADLTGDERFAWDSYRRFIQMYANIVMDVPGSRFEEKLSEMRARRGVVTDSQISAADLRELVATFKGLVKKETGKAMPTECGEQLWGAIGAVFSSWNSARAASYRKIHRISDSLGTAVNVQAMVFGNMGETSATGVAFTRDPNTGDRKFFGEYLRNAQGEDVVAGIRTPFPLNRESGKAGAGETMQEALPGPYAELVKLQQRLESHYRDMQDIEFTVQKGKLFLLQTRSGKRTALAAVRMAVDMVKEKLISPDEAVFRVEPSQIEQLLHPRLDPKAKKEVLAHGLPASPGAASGIAVFSSEEAETARSHGVDSILVRHETSPEDISGMNAAAGFLTALGGMTSHAAVVARGMGKPCITGCSSLHLDETAGTFKAGAITVKKGDIVTIDGSTGQVMLGKVPTLRGQVDESFNTLMKWADERRQLEVRANAETPTDVRAARQFGAQGVGLARTEHMFFDEKRILSVRKMILAVDERDRKAALDELYPMQKGDFLEIFREMKGLPVTIRLLDPPLHEFLPHTDLDTRALATAIGLSESSIRERIESLREQNPMLGHRGCRLGVSFPEIYRMQVRAIMDAAQEALEESGEAIVAEIMIPFISSTEELKQLKALVVNECEASLKGQARKIPYRIGTMIEIPRAALLADKLAGIADFFSFGTNDLTQMTLGMSRDDSGSFLPLYVDKGLFPTDPFVSLDIEGVGLLVEMAARQGRETNPGIKLGICGEQGGDPATIAFCQSLGLTYVSCSPYRVPVARLAAAQAALLDKARASVRRLSRSQVSRLAKRSKKSGR